MAHIVVSGLRLLAVGAVIAIGLAVARPLSVQVRNNGGQVIAFYGKEFSDRYLSANIRRDVCWSGQTWSLGGLRGATHWWWISARKP